MNSIPLLRLPFLVIQDVVSIMNPFEFVYGESSVPGGPDIKREDGKKARVILGASMLDMYIH
ncbi:hypothetical protein CAEBREN_02831 [Caenorhabditis brenneri]|uniref:Uncharacterized protein n=1 Tax=Caenorhabditis brenneri TaxID=135651 RepID=G0N6X6_CAEBE|nr:hypothetical protein CAEBREN_02831 [Caenorhabditis brenneri]